MHDTDAQELRALYELAGLSGYDTAVPQEWYDANAQEIERRGRPLWLYEAAAPLPEKTLFGRPLYPDEIIPRALYNMESALRDAGRQHTISAIRAIVAVAYGEGHRHGRAQERAAGAVATAQLADMRDALAALLDANAAGDMSAADVVSDLCETVPRPPNVHDAAIEQAYQDARDDHAQGAHVLDYEPPDPPDDLWQSIADRAQIDPDTVSVPDVYAALDSYAHARRAAAADLAAGRSIEE
jgi:hypothetical protein